MAAKAEQQNMLKAKEEAMAFEAAAKAKAAEDGIAIEETSAVPSTEAEKDAKIPKSLKANKKKKSTLQRENPPPAQPLTLTGEEKGVKAAAMRARAAIGQEEMHTRLVLKTRNHPLIFVACKDGSVRALEAEVSLNPTPLAPCQ